MSSARTLLAESYVLYGARGRAIEVEMNIHAARDGDLWYKFTLQAG